MEESAKLHQEIKLQLLKAIKKEVGLVNNEYHFPEELKARAEGIRILVESMNSFI